MELLVAGGVSCILAGGSPIHADANAKSTPPWVATKTVWPSWASAMSFMPARARACSSAKDSPPVHLARPMVVLYTW